MVKEGDGCYQIAQDKCGDGIDYNEEICDAKEVCLNLAVGMSIKYDCGKQQKFC